MLALSYMSSNKDKTTTWSINNIREHCEGSETPSPALCCLEATIQWQGGCLFINSCVSSGPFWEGTLSNTLGTTLKSQYKSLFPPPFWIWACKKRKEKRKRWKLPSNKAKKALTRPMKGPKLSDSGLAIFLQHGSKQSNYWSCGWNILRFQDWAK